MVVAVYIHYVLKCCNFMKVTSRVLHLNYPTTTDAFDQEL